MRKLTPAPLQLFSIDAMDLVRVEALMAEWLRRMLKAHVRKSVGSIPTECNYFLLFAGWWLEQVCRGHKQKAVPGEHHLGVPAESPFVGGQLPGVHRRGGSLP